MTGEERSDGDESTGTPRGESVDGADRSDDRPRDVRGTLRWFLHTDEDPVAFVREFGRSAAMVLLVGLLLFGVSGVWPPMVAVESPSMVPHMQPGDLVFLMEETRLAPAAAQAGTGVVPLSAAESTDYRRFGGHGDVVVFATPQRERGGQPPIIHRAHLWVEEGENWYDRANPEYVRASGCGDSPEEGLRYCPAPHDGFITKGDANAYYDQSQGLSPPVRQEWIRGTAEVRVPWLGCVRLYFEGAGSVPETCRV